MNKCVKTKQSAKVNQEYDTNHTCVGFEKCFNSLSFVTGLTLLVSHKVMFVLIESIRNRGFSLYRYMYILFNLYNLPTCLDKSKLSAGREKQGRKSIVTTAWLGSF